MPNITIEITREEIAQISRAFLIAAESPRCQEVNWEITAKLLAKIDVQQVMGEQS